MAQQQRVVPNVINTEIDRWFREPCIHIVYNKGVVDCYYRGLLAELASPDLYLVLTHRSSVLSSPSSDHGMCSIMSISPNDEVAAAP
jgi:hypothetical protein